LKMEIKILINIFLILNDPILYIVTSNLLTNFDNIVAKKGNQRI